MGLFLDGDGIPLAFTTFPGNQNEQSTLKPLEKKIIKDFNKSEFVVCTNAGFASNANRKFNNINGRKFVTTQSLKNKRILKKRGYTYNLEQIQEVKRLMIKQVKEQELEEYNEIVNTKDNFKTTI